MFLYELAIELDQRSVDLAEAAADLGMAELGPTSTLDSQQVMALRARFGRGSVPPPPPRPGAMPLPSVPTAPLAFGEASAATPLAPVAWGAPTAPPDWGPPPAPPPGAAVPPPPPEPQRTAPPISGLGDAFVPPIFEVPPAPPPMPPPGTTKVHAGGFHAGGGIPATDDDGLSKGQIAALLVVGILVVGLFAFMVSNTGPDKKRQQELRAAEASATTVTFQASTTTTLATTTTVPPATTTTINPSVARNGPAFCEAIRPMAAFELRMVAAEVERDFPRLQQLLRTDVPAWERAVTAMKASGPPQIDAAIDSYWNLYQEFFAAIRSSTSFPDLARHIDPDELVQSARGSGRQINIAIARIC